MKYFGVILLGYFLFFSCVSDEERRLQTDQSFEGEEMFNVSYSLGEHISYVLQPFTFYQDTLNYISLPGCPEIDLNEENKQVQLVFGMRECPTNLTGRSGKIILTYLDSLSQEDQLTLIGYEDYQVRGIKMEGLRFVKPDSIFTDSLYRDSLSNFTVTDAQQSTSNFNAGFTHQIVSSDSILQIITSGSASGRNLAGRPFEMEILQEKRVFNNCLRNGFSVPESGEETWTFERTGELDVTHRIIYQQAPECNHTALIQLHDGREIIKTQ